MTKLKTFPRWSIYRHFVKHALNCGNRKWKTQILTSQHMPEILAFFKSDEKLPKPNNVDLWYLYENRNVTLKPQIIFLLHCPKGNRWFAVGVSPFLSKHVFFYIWLNISWFLLLLFVERHVPEIVPIDHSRTWSEMREGLEGRLICQSCVKDLLAE